LAKKKTIKSPPLLSLDTVLNETKVAVNEQSARISSIDTRLGVLLGLSGVILAATLSFPITNCVESYTRYLLVIAVGFMLVSIISATLGYWMRRYRVPPEPSILRELYLKEEQEKTKLAVLLYYEERVYPWNQHKIVSKLRCTRVSFTSVLVGTVIIGVVIILNMV
jgi:hypothetical protein